ncbi:hypothetical protein SLEP1_g20854 [Rubroshorea leprosula]|uniref:Signal peptidase complex-like protein DTM1 n=1 Tax=Rubroshorea leprosula TaxID=152421 RepID=A0AAV5J415_9ROSI|nr:hypothetical protein SLEP1_g20854 [Rubroshorea leprosula]
MVNDAALRSSMVCLAATIVAVGLWTLSLKKMMVTYVVFMLGIAGVLLPDWEYFDRDFFRWCYPVTSEERDKLTALAQRSLLRRYRIYPLRIVVYGTIYGYGLYKWWKFVSS